MFYRLDFQITNSDIFLQTYVPEILEFNLFKLFVVSLYCLIYWDKRAATGDGRTTWFNHSYFWRLWERCPTSIYALPPIILTYVVSYFSSAPPRKCWDNTFKLGQNKLLSHRFQIILLIIQLMMIHRVRYWRCRWTNKKLKVIMQWETFCQYNKSEQNFFSE